MLRIFRRRFLDAREALEDIARLRVVERYLPAAQIARSEEFLSDYLSPRGPEVLLCGLQVFVEGIELDPWAQSLPGELRDALVLQVPGPVAAVPAFSQRLCASAARFVHCTRRMIRETGTIPDLAGRGNLRVTAEGVIVLVDINNISSECYAEGIPLDDRGYPVCDKSVEAMTLLERRFCGVRTPESDPLRRHFFHPARRRRVQELDASFHHRRLL
jgi:hypothetical protein